MNIFSHLMFYAYILFILIFFNKQKGLKQKIYNILNNKKINQKYNYRF